MCLGQVSPPVPPSHKLQYAPCDQRLGVLNFCKEYDAACSRDLGPDSGYFLLHELNDSAMIVGFEIKQAYYFSHINFIKF